MPRILSKGSVSLFTAAVAGLVALQAAQAGDAGVGMLGGKPSAYSEFASAVSSRDSDTNPLVLTADTGLIYQLTSNVALDINGFFGLTRGAPDYNVFGGIGVRF